MLVITSLVALLFASAATSPRRASSYADWVRQQLLNPTSELAETALSEATAKDPLSLQAFLEAFLEAVEAEQPHASPANLFVEYELSNDALITYLQGRFSRVVGEAVLTRITIGVASPSHNSLSLKHQSSPGTWAKPAFQALATKSETLNPAFRLVKIPLRWVLTAQPLGP